MEHISHSQVDSRISQSVTIEFVGGNGETAALEADLVYDAQDPFAVTTVFRASGQAVAWTFARDLLIDGCYEPSGDGDVHVWPCLSSDGSAVVIVELCSPDGELLVQVPAREVHPFVTRMLTLVPQGLETSYVDLDAMIADLLV